MLIWKVCLIHRVNFYATPHRCCSIEWSLEYDLINSFQLKFANFVHARPDRVHKDVKKSQSVRLAIRFIMIMVKISFKKVKKKVKK